jgi:hypothetical protein
VVGKRILPRAPTLLAMPFTIVFSAATFVAPWLLLGELL